MVAVRIYNPTNVFIFLALYVAGMVVGLLANLALDVQLHRPDLRQSSGLVLFAFVLWGALSVTHTAFTQILLPLVWLGTGLLVGLGSKQPVGHG